MRAASQKQVHASSRRKLTWDAITWKTVGRKVKQLQMRIAKAIRNRMTGSLHNRKRPLKCLSRVRGNSHARFLGGLGLETAPGYPAKNKSSAIAYPACSKL